MATKTQLSTARQILNSCARATQEAASRTREIGVTLDVPEMAELTDTFYQEVIRAVDKFHTATRKIATREGLICCDLCGEPVMDGRTDIVTGRPRHAHCVPY